MAVILKTNSWSTKSNSNATINAIYRIFDQVETYRDLLIVYRPTVINKEVPKNVQINDVTTMPSKSNTISINVAMVITIGHICKKRIVFRILPKIISYVLCEHLTYHV